MKVADLMEDLETGDRSMEHLNKPEETPRSFADEMRRVMDAMSGIAGQAVGGIVGGGPVLGGLNGLAQQQNLMNQMQSQSLANQQALGMQNMQAGRLW